MTRREDIAPEKRLGLQNLRYSLRRDSFRDSHHHQIGQTKLPPKRVRGQHQRCEWLGVKLSGAHMLSSSVLAKIEANRLAALEKKRLREADSEFGSQSVPRLIFAQSSEVTRMPSEHSKDRTFYEDAYNPMNPHMKGVVSAQENKSDENIFERTKETSTTRGSVPEHLNPIHHSNQNAEPLNLNTKHRHQLSTEQQNVWAEVIAGKSCFLTGCGGTGKSYLTNQLISALKEKYGKSSVAVTATTGIAACQIGGTTLHTFAGIGLAKEPAEDLIEMVLKNKKSVDRWKKTSCLVIDEISMLDGDFFDKLEAIARSVRRDERPFGGMQLLLVGDFLQLPPIAKKDGQRSFCFDAAAWDRVVDLNVELTEVFRQQNLEFVHMLNSLRIGVCTSEISERLRSTKDNCLNEISGIQATRIYARNVEVEDINYKKVCQLPGKMIALAAEDNGEQQYLKNIDSSCLAPKILNLKPGAQVMLLKNLDTEAGLTNGTRGVVDRIDEIEDDKNGDVVPRVSFDTKNGIITRLVKKEVFSTEAQGRIVASRTQFPLRLAYAITIHKCQGMTLSKVELSLKDVFEHGQAYVALSRVSDLAGLRLLDFNPGVVKAHPRVLNFYKEMHHRRKRSSSSFSHGEELEVLPMFRSAEVTAPSSSRCTASGPAKPNPLFLYD